MPQHNITYIHLNDYHKIIILSMRTHIIVMHILYKCLPPAAGRHRHHTFDAFRDPPRALSTTHIPFANPFMAEKCKYLKRLCVLWAPEYLLSGEWFTSSLSFDGLLAKRPTTVFFCWNKKGGYLTACNGWISARQGVLRHSFAEKKTGKL